MSSPGRVAGQDGSGYGIYARRYAVNGNAVLGAAGNEIHVSTSTQGDQVYPAVAESHVGTFVISWDGNGTQTGQQDPSGVFVQQYFANATANGGETRVNLTTGGVRQYASVGMDGDGNYVVAWTGPSTSNPANTDVFTSPSAAVQPVTPDPDGPIVCYVTLPNLVSPLTGQTADLSGQIVDGTQEGTREPTIGAVLQPASSGVQALTFVFDEDMLTVGGTTGVNSILNPANWTLTYNSAAVVGGISRIDYGWNPLAQKYEANVYFNAAALGQAGSALPKGSYVLTLSSAVANADNSLLDALANGQAGSAAVGSGGYQFPFSLANGATVNVPVTPNPLPPGDGANARTYPQTPEAVAVDGQGD